MTSNEAPGDFVSYAGHTAEYTSALAALDLEIPPGVTLPIEPPAEPEPGTQYEVGGGEVQALFAWLHSVETAAVEAHFAGDDSTAQHWVEVAAQFVNTPTFQKYNDHNFDSESGTSWFAAVIEPARRGDFKAMLEELHASN